MDTNKRTPMQLFNMPQHFVIPLFQRPYVWDQQQQWEPLWHDIRRVTELRMGEPHLSPQHFLGAIVLQSQTVSSSRPTTWNVIDGQQRLTTLQLLMDATSSVLDAPATERFADQLGSLTHNPAMHLPDPEDQLKLRHLNKDRDPFREVMDAEPPVDHSALKNGDSKIVRAHQYFATEVRLWLGDPGTEEHQRRAEHLTSVLQSDLLFVTIELSESENSQEIFETLNARGTPLTAADLVRNFVFQRLESEGSDIKAAYDKEWPFESKFWNKEVSVGRYPISRSSLFLNQWLVSRTGEEIGPQSTFGRFKSYVDHQHGLRVADLLPTIKEQADLYEAWTRAAESPSGNLSPAEMAVYRMAASNLEALKPLLIWLHQPGRDLPQTVIDSVIQTAESWIYRRQLLRLPGTDHGRIVADLIASHSDAPVDELPGRIRSRLALLNASGSYWPDDEEVRTALMSERAYQRFPRARLRAFLETAENALRAETGQPQIERVGYPIEHILPQSWAANWAVDSPEESQDRQAHVHRLGNLTLLTAKLNSKVSNGSWETKRKALLQHNTVKLTGLLVQDDQEWNEESIDRRTRELVDLLLTVWPVPEGHTSAIVDAQKIAPDWIQLKHLLKENLLTEGERLTPRTGAHTGVDATIAADGAIIVNGKRFATPSAAAKHVRGGSTNGWVFWSLTDGRRLSDVRTEYLGKTNI